MVAMVAIIPRINSSKDSADLQDNCTQSYIDEDDFLYPQLGKYTHR